MSRSPRRATLGALVFFVVAPGATAGLVPWLLNGWRRPVVGLTRWVAVVLIFVGFATAVAAFVQFVVEGRGTPAPVAPTEVLVVGGLYRWTRNPMYQAVAAMIGGQALLFSSRSTLAWLGVFMLTVWTFVTAYEQPVLLARFGEDYRRYREAVPGWHPRMRPWSG